MSKHRIWILTLSPSFYVPFLETGVVGKALRGERGSKVFELSCVPLGEYSLKGYKGVDDAPYGGGQGMVIRADVLRDALLKGVVEKGGYGENWREKIKVIFPSPRGKIWKTDDAKKLSKNLWGSEPMDVVFLCGRYEGVDQRFIDHYVDSEISLGDFILSNGDIATLAILDSAMRFVPGVVGNSVSVGDESFEGGLLENSLYTRPSVFEGLEAPSVLLSGHHEEIGLYRKRERERITQKKRPDLLSGGVCS